MLINPPPCSGSLVLRVQTCSTGLFSLVSVQLNKIPTQPFLTFTAGSSHLSSLWHCQWKPATPHWHLVAMLASPGPQGQKALGLKGHVQVHFLWFFLLKHQNLKSQEAQDPSAQPPPSPGRQGQCTDTRALLTTSSTTKLPLPAAPHTSER